MKHLITSLLSQKMTRKQFLQKAGGVMLIAFGITGASERLTHMLRKGSDSHATVNSQSKKHYGKGSYGA